MNVGVLFSGGKDSSLAALLLEPLADVTLLTATFGVTHDHEHAAAAGRALGFPVEALELDAAVAEAAVEQLVADGFPRNGIQQVHEHALERAPTGTPEGSDSFDAIADGTRRDDRVPTVSRSLAQSLEDRHGIHHLAPLAGFGRGAIDHLVEANFTVESGPSEALPTGDYEGELRTLLLESHGVETVEDIFPPHEQSRVTGRL